VHGEAELQRARRERERVVVRRVDEPATGAGSLTASASARPRERARLDARPLHLRRVDPGGVEGEGVRQRPRGDVVGLRAALALELLALACSASLS
jgi:hypothetical protein